MNRFFCLLSLFLVLLSCSGKRRNQLGMEKDLPTCISNRFFSDPEADFQKVKVGMSIAEFSQATGYAPAIAQNDVVLDSVSFCGIGSNYSEVTYEFNGGKVLSIEVLCFFEKGNSISGLMDHFRMELSKKYGKAISDKGTVMWEFIRQETSIQVFLSDESFIYQRPVIRLIFLNLLVGIST